MTPSKKIDDLYDLIEGIETAMFTTRRSNGQLVSRPMATQHRIEGADLWFVTNVDTHKLDELALDPHVNCAYYNKKTREWVSVSGVATSRRTGRAFGSYTRKTGKSGSVTRAVTGMEGPTIRASHSSWLKRRPLPI